MGTGSGFTSSIKYDEQRRYDETEELSSTQALSLEQREVWRPFQVAAKLYIASQLALLDSRKPSARTIAAITLSASRRTAASKLRPESGWQRAERLRGARLLGPVRGSGK